MATRTATAERPAEQRQAAQPKPTVQPGTSVAVSGERAKSVLYDMADRFGMEPAAFEETLRNTVVPGNCSREQFAAFLLVAKEYNLNPLLKEIYAFPAKGGGIQPIVGIDGWSNLVNSHPAFDGLEFDDILDPHGALVSITCRMFRKDRSRSIPATEYMIECKRNTEPWQKWPRRMLRHKAMIQAARYAFGFAGIVDPDEAERFAAETARDVTPTRVASTAAAFDEFAKLPAIHTTEPVADELSDPPPPEENGLSDFSEDEVQQPEKPAPKAAPKQAAAKPEPQPKAETKVEPPADPEPEGPADGAADLGDAPRHPPGEFLYTGEVETDAEPDKAAWPMRRLPKTPAEYSEYVTAFTGQMTEASKIGIWFKSPDQRDLRNKCFVTREDFDAARDIASKAIVELSKAKG